MPTLHALLVAINDYPDPRHVLHGCVDDMEDFKQYLETFCRLTHLGFRPVMLRDAAATREAVITAFMGHFKEAAADDPCLFYYAGHGARCDAPEAFWKLEPDKKMESIVCYDSRSPGGHDLMDKELSWLVWQASRDKNLPFVTITDCCHSGSMRAPVTNEVLIREIREAGSALPPHRFQGYEDYKTDASGMVSPPLGRRVHLGAARDVETAKEAMIGDKRRGVFTHCLVETLRDTGPFVSYSSLLSRVQMRVYGKFRDQSPQVESTNPEDKRLLFLSGKSLGDQEPFMVAYDQQSAAWMLNAGALHGLQAGKLELLEDGHIIELQQVFPGRSRVSNMEGYDPKRAYPVSRPIPAIRFAVAPGSDPAAIEALVQRRPDLFDPDQLHGSTGFLVHAREQSLYLTRGMELRPLFPPAGLHAGSPPDDFLKALDKVARWQQVLELDNPASSIQEGDLEVCLYRVTDPGNEENDAPVEQLELEGARLLFPYALKGNTWRRPAFQLKVKNTGQKTLWVSLLFMGSDFSISNKLLPGKALAPGEEAWATDVYDNFPYQTIPLEMEAHYKAYLDDYLRQMRSRGQQPDEEVLDALLCNEDCLKLIVCTEEFSTDALTQKGVAEEPARVQGRRRMLEKPDWTTIEIWLSTERTDWKSGVEI